MRNLWWVLPVFLIALLFNLDRVGRHYYPFHYRELIQYHARQYELDPYLVAAIIKTESNFNPRARSPEDARGLMQILPETGRWIAEHYGEQGFQADYLYNPAYNIRLGTRYLAYLFQEFNGNVIVVLAAYNGGLGNVRVWLEETGWTGERYTLDQIPFPETRQFVRKVLWTQRLYRYLYKDLATGLSNTAQHTGAPRADIRVIPVYSHVFAVNPAAGAFLPWRPLHHQAQIFLTGSLRSRAGFV